MRKDEKYHSLPANVRHAIDVGKQKAKHSEFYYRLKGLNERRDTYKEIFYDKVPVYQRTYMQKQLERKQEVQKVHREVFEREVQTMKLDKRKLKRFQSSIDVITATQSGISNRLKKKVEEFGVVSPTSPTSSKEGAKFNIKDY